MSQPLKDAPMLLGCLGLDFVTSCDICILIYNPAWSVTFREILWKKIPISTSWASKCGVSKTNTLSWDSSCWWAQVTSPVNLNSVNKCTVVENLIRCFIQRSFSKPTSSLPVLTMPVLDSKSQSWLNCKVFLWTHIFLWPLSTITLKLISNCNLAMFEHSSPVRKDEEHSPQNVITFLALLEVLSYGKCQEFRSSFTGRSASLLIISYVPFPVRMGYI